jgi:serine/threonine protein kinase
MDEQGLFAAALQLPADQREAFLDDACAGNRSLRKRLARLIAADESGRGILDHGPNLSPAPPEALAVGQVFADHYRLTRKLGEGGMGEVWAADQTEPFPRLVALKFLQDRYDPRSPIAARFLAEARITARLQHPGIPPVHYVHELPDGRPFLVMKLIAGRTLDELLREQGPDPSRWLGAFEAICQAVGYAHSNGVIHRDLKPSNVMVGAFGEVQVMDWGLAKVVADERREQPGTPADVGIPPAAFDPTDAESDSLTRPGSVMGTPAFMSPEQAAGTSEAVDRRSDVFGLGAVLCALLTGRPPDPVPGQLRSADEGDRFARLETCGAAPELVALCKHCLAPESSDRPADAGAVAAAVAELRRGAEERARTAEVDRARAEVHAAEHRKRRRLALVSSTILSLVLLAGVIGTTFGLIRAERARVNESVQRAAAETARDSARDVLDAMTSDIAGDALVRQQEISEEQKRFLVGALDHYRAFAREGADDEPGRRRIAAAAYRLGQIEDRLGRREEAVAAFRQSLQSYEALSAADPTETRYLREMANCHNCLGCELSNLGQRRQDEAHHRQALAIREKLATENPNAADYRRELSATYYNLGLLLAESDRKSEAREQLESAVAVREKLAAETPLSSVGGRELAAARTALANVLVDLGERTNAERLYRSALPMLEWLTVAFPLTPDYRRELAVTLNGLGNVRLALEDRPAAEEYLRRALTLRERLAVEYPGVAESRREQAMTLTNLAQLFLRAGKRPAAEDHFRRALAIYEKLRTDFPLVQAYQVELGNSYFGFGAFVFGAAAADSLPWFDKAVRTLEPVHQADPAHDLAKRQLCNGYRARAMALDRMDRSGDAVKDWNRALELARPDVRLTIRAARATSLVRSGEVARAVAEVAKLQEKDGWTAAELYDMACVYSVVGAKTPDRRQDFADRAMELLGRAVAAGWNDAVLTKEDTDLNPLRQRDDFRQLLADLEKRFPPKK